MIFVLAKFHRSPARFVRRFAVGARARGFFISCHAEIVGLWHGVFNGYGQRVHK